VWHVLKPIAENVILPNALSVSDSMPFIKADALNRVRLPQSCKLAMVYENAKLALWDALIVIWDWQAAPLAMLVS
jgi:hypothetical protein